MMVWKSRDCTIMMPLSYWLSGGHKVVCLSINTRKSPPQMLVSVGDLKRKDTFLVLDRHNNHDILHKENAAEGKGI